MQSTEGFASATLNQETGRITIFQPITYERSNDEEVIMVELLKGIAEEVQVVIWFLLVTLIK